MEYRILQKKLLFLHHVATLAEDTLAREVYEVQKTLALPGLYQECHGFLVKCGVTEVKNYSKLQWKKMVKDEIFKMNKNHLLLQIKSYKKLSYETHERDTFERKEYLTKLNISQARLRFKLTCFMTPTVMMNFPSDVKFAHKLWTCSGCSESYSGGEVVGCRDTQQHIMICAGYAQLRHGRDLNKDKDLVEYFSKVIKKRQDIISE